MRHQRCVIAVHRAWRVEQHGQQILPDIPNSRCVLLQAVHDETDMLAVRHGLLEAEYNEDSEYPAISAGNVVQRAKHDEQLLHRSGRA